MAKAKKAKTEMVVDVTSADAFCARSAQEKIRHAFQAKPSPPDHEVSDTGRGNRGDPRKGKGSNGQVVFLRRKGKEIRGRQKVGSGKRGRNGRLVFQARQNEAGLESQGIVRQTKGGFSEKPELLQQKQHPNSVKSPNVAALGELGKCRLQPAFFKSRTGKPVTCNERI